MKMRFALLFTCLSLAGIFDARLQAQNYVKMMQDPTANFYDVQREFQTYWSGRTIEKGKGFKAFKRWEYVMEPRVYPSGDMRLPQMGRSQFYQIRDNWMMSRARGYSAASWVFMGPTGKPTNGGAGRVNFIRFSPTDTATFFAGTPNGGLWKTTNGGSTYTNIADQVDFLGCSDLAIDPTNTNIMYMATGDADAADIYSYGILKTVDGGANWDSTGLTFNLSAYRRVNRILLNPLNHNTILAALSDGIYKSYNAGVTWTHVLTTTVSVTDMEFKPGDTTTVYCCSDVFYRSTNGGSTWTSAGITGLPASTNVARFSIAVSPANSAYVYVLGAKASDNGYLGLYQSTNSGTTFTTRSTTPNLLGFNSTGTDVGGQGWYTLSLAVSPTNVNEVFVGGVNIWKSTNGGTSWAFNADWTGGAAPYVHADIHDIVYNPSNSSKIYVGSDGGVFRTLNTGTNWYDFSSNLQIAQIYRIGNSASNATLWITGHQDNGTNLKNGASYSEVNGGDGMECFIDRTLNTTMYSEVYNGDFYRSTNSGATWTNIITGLAGSAAWVTPWQQSPLRANTLYAGYSDIYKSVNQGTSWTRTTAALTSGTTIVDFKVAPSDTLTIYVIKNNALYKTINGGTSWTTITGTLPVGSASLTRVEVNASNPNKVWVSFSGYSSGAKVYYSTNGGTTWTNYSTGLPNIPVNAICYDRMGVQGLYAGTDAGVYYRDTTMSTWQTFLAGMPNVMVYDLEIYYPTKKIRAATYGRGVWESILAFDTTGIPPVASFTYLPASPICQGDTVRFTNTSTGTGNAYTWTFPGGTPRTSTAVNPVVYFDTSGSVNVTLVATNSGGTNSTNSVITVRSNPKPNISLAGNVFSTTTTGSSYQWYKDGVAVAGQTNMRDTVSVSGLYKVLVTQSNGCSRFSDTLRYTLPLPTPAFTFLPASPICQADTVRFTNTTTGLGTITYAWTFPGGTPGTSTATNPVVYFDTSGTITVTLVATNASGSATTTRSIVIRANPKPNISLASNVFSTTTTGSGYQWYMNGAAVAGQTNMRDTVSASGLYKVLVTQSNGCSRFSDTLRYTLVPPVANFTFLPASPICQADTVRFTNTSTGTGNTYVWTFPGGTPRTSTAANPVVYFDTSGSVNVSLVATNVGGTNTRNTVITVRANPKPNISLAGNVFSTTTTGSSYQWYKDGVAVAGQTNMRDTVSVSGLYKVLVAQANGCSRFSDTLRYTLPLPTPAFTYLPASPICQSDTVRFTNTTAGLGTITYSWTFPGGTPRTSTAANPVVYFDTSGTITVTLVASNASGSASTTSSIVIRSNPKPNISLAGNVFSTSTSGSGYQWYLNGSAIAGQTNMRDTALVSGLYKVLVTQANGCSRFSDTLRYTLGSPVADFTYLPASPICQADTVRFTNTTSGTGPFTYVWTFPGGTPRTSTAANPVVYFDTSGTINVTLVSTNGAGSNSRSYAITIRSNPKPTISLAGSVLSTAAGGSTYQWYRNGSSIPGATNRLDTVLANGLYKVLVSYANGCSRFSDTLRVSITPPVASFTYTPASPVCQGDTIRFTNTSTGSPTSVSWTFPGGTPRTSTANNPVVYFDTSGIVNVSLTVSNAGGSNSTSQNITVRSNPIPTITPSGTYLSTAAVGTGYQWYLNGSPIALATGSSDTARTTGNYTVRVTYANSCSRLSAPVFVNIMPAPVSSFSMSPSPVCQGDTVQFTDMSTNSPISWSWSFSGASPSSSSYQNPKVVYTSAGTFPVSLTATNAAGSNMFNSNITVYPNPAPIVNVSGSLLTASLTGSYRWFFNGGLISSEIGQTMTANASGLYAVEVTDSNGCTGMSAATMVQVNTGINDVVDNAMMNVFPNPNQGVFVIDIKLPDAKRYDVKMTDVLGRTVWEQSVQNSRTVSIPVDMQQLNKGVYFVQLSDARGVKAIRKVTVY